jgi:hypothetical protein
VLRTPWLTKRRRLTSADVACVSGGTRTRLCGPQLREPRARMSRRWWLLPGGTLATTSRPRSSRALLAAKDGAFRREVCDLAVGGKPRRRDDRRVAVIRSAVPDTRAEVGRHEGNHGSYVEDLMKRNGPDADQPHRVQYRKLVRA